MTLSIISVRISYQYNVRLAVFYEACVDSLPLVPSREMLKELSLGMKFDEFIHALYPEALDFGKTPKTATAQAMELLKDVIKSGGKLKGESYFMSIHNIYEDINAGRITFGPHLNQRMWENGLSIDEVFNTILTGTINKKEKGEYSHGKFTKFTISKGGIIVVVKDCKPGFIITANRR